MSPPARVCVGTYAEYNYGSIEGAWLDLEDCRNKFEFDAACQKRHGVGDNEFIFQDHEGIPANCISESALSGDVWEEWICLDVDDKEVGNVHLGNVNQDGPLYEAKDAFQGQFVSDADWASDYWESTGLLQSIPASLQSYIDYVAYGRDARLGGDVTFVKVEYMNV